MICNGGGWHDDVAAARRPMMLAPDIVVGRRALVISCGGDDIVIRRIPCVELWKPWCPHKRVSRREIFNFFYVQYMSEERNEHVVVSELFLDIFEHVLPVLPRKLIQWIVLSWVWYYREEVETQ